MLGGMTGSGLTALLVERVGTENLVLFSAAILGFCFFLILEIQRRTNPEEARFRVKARAWEAARALSMLKGSRHLQLIALVIGFSALGAATLEQQLYMASESAVAGKDSITSFSRGSLSTSPHWIRISDLLHLGSTVSGYRLRHGGASGQPGWDSHPRPPPARLSGPRASPAGDR
jgi:hypothetical protein